MSKLPHVLTKYRFHELTINELSILITSSPDKLTLFFVLFLTCSTHHHKNLAGDKRQSRKLCQVGLGYIVYTLYGRAL